MKDLRCSSGRRYGCSCTRTNSRSQNRKYSKDGKARALSRALFYFRSFWCFILCLAGLVFIMLIHRESKDSIQKLDEFWLKPTFQTLLLSVSIKGFYWIR